MEERDIPEAWKNLTWLECDYAKVTEVKQDQEMEYCASVNVTVDDVYASQIIVGMESDDNTLCILVIISHSEFGVVKRSKKASDAECNKRIGGM